MAHFLIQGGANVHGDAPPVAFRDETLPDHPDAVAKKVKDIETAAAEQGVSLNTTGAAMASGGGTAMHDVLSRSGRGLQPGQKRAHIPGYGGFVQNAKDVAGRSQTRVARRCLDKDVRRILTGDIIPSSPHATHKIPEAGRRDTLVGEQQRAGRLIPGYSGHVPQRTEALGVSFVRVADTHLEKTAALGRSPKKHADGPPIDAKECRRTMNRHIVGSLHLAPKPKPKLVVRDKGVRLSFMAQ